MFRRFEKLLNPTALPADPEPPASLMAFYWHFAKQAKWLFITLMVVELFQATLDAVIPWFFGRIVTLADKVPPSQYLSEGWPLLVGLAAVLLIARPAVILARYLIT